MKTRNAAAIIFYDTDRRILLQERGSHSKLGEEWGFFGGKIEDGETSEQTIKREMKEELNYDLKDFKFLGKFEYKPFKEWHITVEMYTAPMPPQRDLKLTEGKSARLFKISETENLNMVPGDHIVIKAAEKYINEVIQ